MTAGPSLDIGTQKIVLVNTDEHCAFENEYMKVKVMVRIKDFQGTSRDHPKEKPCFFTTPTAYTLTSLHNVDGE